MRNQLKLLASGIVAALVFVSCGGGEKLGAIQGTGLTTPATVVGPITGFGSIFVNGVEYATSSAQIRIDGQPGTESELRVGQIVTVKGTVNSDERTGTANEVSFVGDAQGPVAQLDVAGDSFVVLGQLVRVVEETLFDETLQPTGIEGLQNGTVVAVSGFANAAGELVASRIDVKSASAALQVSGTIQALDTAARTFQVNALTVDYSGVTPVGTLANGSTANVQGTTTATSGLLRATSVQVSAGLGGAPNERGEVEGFISSFTSNTDFVIKGQRITTNNATELEPRGLVLGLNVAVEVEGSFDSSSVLVADQVKEKRISANRVRGLVDSVSAASNTLSVIGVAVTTSIATALDDKSDQKLRPFRLSDMRVGDFVDVRGAPNPAGGLVATVVERRRPEDRSTLEGTALNVAEPNLTVLGIAVMTNAQTQFVGLGDPPAAAARFFSEAPNQVVEVRGTLSGSVFIADRAQIKSRDDDDDDDEGDDEDDED